MNSPLEILLMICLIVLAFITVQTRKLRRAAIFLGAFSLICSFAYLIYNAPDVALAEAVIGCTLSTILILIALKKYHVITIYYVINEQKDSAAVKREKKELSTTLENFLVERGFEPQIIPTHLDERILCQNECFNLLIEHTTEGIIIYSSGIRYLERDIEDYLEKHKPKGLDISFYKLKDQTEDDIDELE